MKTILVLVPMSSEVVNNILSNNTDLHNFFQSLSGYNHNFILKTHPRHSRLDLNNLGTQKNIFVENGNNIKELIEKCDLAIALESSSAILDVLFYEKPLIYIKDFIIHFNNEIVLFNFLENLSKLSFCDLDELLKSDLGIDLERFKSNYNKDNILYNHGNASIKKTIEKLYEIIRD